MMTKQEILDYLDNVLHPIVSPDNWNVYSELHDMIEELPPAEPVRYGKWIEKSTGGEHFHCCSKCGYVEWDTPSNYCSRCGARMDEE